MRRPRWIPQGQALRHNGTWWRLCVYPTYRSTDFAGFVECDAHGCIHLGRHANERTARLAALRAITKVG